MLVVVVVETQKRCGNGRRLMNGGWRCGKGLTLHHVMEHGVLKCSIVGS